MALLKLTRAVLRSFQWAGDAADRLAFAEVLGSTDDFSADMQEACDVLGIEPSTVTGLEEYLKEYYSRIMKKLKEVGAESKQTDFYI